MLCFALDCIDKKNTEQQSLYLINFSNVVQTAKVELHVSHKVRQFYLIVMGNLSLLAKLQAVLDIDLPAMKFVEVYLLSILKHVYCAYEVNLVLVHA